ncbi:alpha/beta hydrolase family protein [Paenibacillus tuaregi]|uniref:alpha/beta hydrolase family protein n=1 Tax=Paenibacillus tuaregi TaxID=1816681 RepID=UPI00083985E9|nr:dienelactone hydrolase family protein [Paenibacillus tuaregi]
MRVFEMLLVTACAAVMIVLLLRKEANRMAGIITGITCGALLASQLLFEGYRWQMIPAYAVAVVLVIAALFKRRKAGKTVRYTVSSLFVLLLGGSVALSLLLPVFQLPKPTGEFKVGTETLHFVDNSREEIFTKQKGDKRELMVQVWYPAAESGGSGPRPVFPEDPKVFQAYTQGYSGYMKLPAAAFDYWKYFKANAYTGAEVRPANTPYPVVLLSHGMGVGRILHTSQAENLASHGYIVFAVDHTYSTVATAFPDSRVTGFLTNQSQERFYEDSHTILQVWNKDISFIVDQLEKLNTGAIASKFKGKLDINNIGMMGHSFGGATAFEAVYSNPRIKAGINMDGTIFETKGRDDMKKPFMFMESGDFAKVNAEQAKFRKVPITEEELKALKFTRQQFDTVLKNRELELKLIDRATQQGGGKVVYVEGTGHYNFTDLQLYSPIISKIGMTGSINGVRGAELVNHYVLEFFNQHLRGMKSTLLAGPNQDYPEVKYPKSVSLGE